jgi:hypothetical protein
MPLSLPGNSLEGVTGVLEHHPKLVSSPYQTRWWESELSELGARTRLWRSLMGGIKELDFILHKRGGRSGASGLHL